jgi:hypothetical protein
MTVEVMELFFALAGVVDLLDHDMHRQTVQVLRKHRLRNLDQMHICRRKLLVANLGLLKVHVGTCQWRL